MIKELIIKNNPIDFIFIIFVSGIIIFLSSFLPLKHINKMDAVEIIRTAKNNMLLKAKILLRPTSQERALKS